MAVILSFSNFADVNGIMETDKKPAITLKVTGTARLVAKNHVGNNWSKEFYLNREVIKGTGKVTVENGDKISVGCRIIEHDSDSDTAYFTEEIDITPVIMTKGVKIERTVYVIENNGRYSCNAAVWDVVMTIKP